MTSSQAGSSNRSSYVRSYTAPFSNEPLYDTPRDDADDHENLSTSLRRPPSSQSLPSPRVMKNPSRRYVKRPEYLHLPGEEFDVQELYTLSAKSDDPLLTPTPSFLITPRTPTRTHPVSFIKRYEIPEWRKLILHIFLCLIAYPTLLIFIVAARDRTLFWTRFIVGIGCGLVGATLGVSLVELATGLMEAATWATVIHQSRVSETPGIRLRDFAAVSRDSKSALGSLTLLWNRWKYPGTSRRQRGDYDSRPWTLVIVFHLMLVVFAALLPFILGRIVRIDTMLVQQREEYYEIAFPADLSAEDIQAAALLQPAFNNFLLTWTISPHSSHGTLPPPVAFSHESDTVYFAETAYSQVIPGGSGFGTFNDSTAFQAAKKPTALTATDATRTVDPGALLRYPRWGIRIHCEKLANAARNINPRSETNFTYIFTPRDQLRSLFSGFQMEFPSILNTPLNVTAALQPNDTIPTSVDTNTIALSAYFYDNGAAHSFKSVPLTMGQEGYGWVTIETVLIRLNNTYAPNGTFATYGPSVVMPSGEDTRIGFDAAVCLELYEPWIVEVYNSTQGPSSTALLAQSKFIVNVGGEKNVGGSLTGFGINLKTELNSTGLSSVYDTVHGNSINQMLKDNGQDAFYVPSPTLLSYTNGTGPNGYTELSAEAFSTARALADASNVLPYFAGSGMTLTRIYPDRILSNASIPVGEMIGLVAGAFFAGILAAFLVPKLPFGLPRRGFEVYSWMAAFHGDELISDWKRAGIYKNMELKEMEERLGDLRFRYGF